MSRYALAIFLLAGCSNNGGSGPEPRAYTDQAGRTCTTTGNGPSTCNEQPNPSEACTTDYPTPCWDVFPSFPDAGNPIMENCAACCNVEGSGAAASPQDCTPIVCQSDADCPLSFNVCQAGFCTSP